MLADARDAAEMRDQHARRGVEVVLVLVGQRAAAEQFAQFLHRQAAVDQQRAVVAFHHQRIVVLVLAGLDPADHRAHQIIHRDHAGDVAVLVHHQRQRLLFLAEDLQQFQRMRRFGHEHRRAQFAEQIRGLPVEVVEQRFHFQHAEHVGVAAAVHRIARVGRGAHFGEVFGEVGAGVEPDDAGARRHQAFRGAVAQAHDAVHHVAFVVVDQALLVAFADQQADFLLGHVRGVALAEADRAHHRARAPRQRDHEGHGRAREEIHRVGDRGRDPFRAQRADPLGHQFADQAEQEQHDQEAGDEADPARVRRQPVDPGQRHRDARAQGFAAEVAGEQAEQGDPQLHRGQEALRVLGQLQRLARAAAVRGHLLEPHLARGHHRHFGHGEETVAQHQ